MIIAASFSVCSVQGCGKKINACGLCAMHYVRKRKYGDIGFSKYGKHSDGKSEREAARGNGKKRYFTGIPCPNGHIAERLVSNYGCVECSRIKSTTTKSKDRAKKFYEMNKTDVQKKKRAWWRSRPIEKKQRHSSLCAMYPKRVKQATPKWANFRKITDIYMNAKKLGLEVDHIVPIKGKNVCGLHVEINLQLLTKSENCSKNNRGIF